MMKQIFIDSLNGFALKDIPLFLFQLLIAGILGLVIQWTLNRKFSEQIIKNGVALAMIVALLTSLSKFYLPVGVLCAAVILLLGFKKNLDAKGVFGLMLICTAGIGSGSGSVIQTALGLLLIAGIVLFIPMKNVDE